MKNTDKLERRDSLDALLAVAAKRSGEADIKEYGTQDNAVDFSAEFLDKMKKLTSSEVRERRKTRISIKRRFFVAAAAALLVCALAIGGIAGRNRDSAVPTVIAENGVLVLTYDMNGIRPDGDALPKLSGEMTESYTRAYRDGEESTEISFTYKDTEITLQISRLDKDYSAKLCNERDGAASAGYFEILVAGKYNGIAVQTAEGEAVAAWNDGHFAYILRTPLPLEDAVAAADSICT